MEYKNIVFSVESGVATITLNRPDQLNAYTPDMGVELVDAFRNTALDDDVYAVILTGSGRCFCAGADKAYLSGEIGEYGMCLGQEEFVNRFSLELACHPKLTIAAMNGSAVGIGITASLPMDLRISAPNTKLVLNFAELGIIPGMGSSYFLPKILGLSKAKDLLCCRRVVSAEDALSWGLVDYLHANPVVKARELAQASKACKGNTVSKIKSALLHGSASDLASAVDYEWSLVHK